ncbi:hypothetical protein NK718_13655 [Alsobacter sp. SYSU M60028]|uniref:Uncharacterized protein n=1 Tax=Alsobacter ponti TaxID=2962936 RepID=A0ABT1LDI8_9HYPH|nr:hypothetical protein [Alsobacter ponti]MCP8939567.1 hypothetical protein [Alsobacter ponti]
MQLGTLISRLEDETDAAMALEALGDVVLLGEVLRTGELYDETPGEYVANAARRFAAMAGDEDWLGLMNALERADDPARAVLDRMLRWSLTRDAAEQEHERSHAHGHEHGHGGACSCGGGCGGGR